MISHQSRSHEERVDEILRTIKDELLRAEGRTLSIDIRRSQVFELVELRGGRMEFDTGERIITVQIGPDKKSAPLR
jgi:hypothetical protein